MAVLKSDCQRQRDGWEMLLIEPDTWDGVCVWGEIQLGKGL
jgi:hypothetical protein